MTDRYRLEIDLPTSEGNQPALAEGDIRLVLGALSEWLKSNLYPYGVTITVKRLD